MFLQPSLHWKCNTYYIMCVCSVSYPACNTHVPYCSLWPVPTLHYFATLSHKLDNFRNKKILKRKCAFRLPLKHLSEILLIVRRTEKDIIKNV